MGKGIVEKRNFLTLNSLPRVCAQIIQNARMMVSLLGLHSVGVERDRRNYPCRPPPLPHAETIRRRASANVLATAKPVCNGKPNLRAIVLMGSVRSKSCEIG